MLERYLGIDVGGGNNTWTCVLEFDQSQPKAQVSKRTLKEIVDFSRSRAVLGSAIDAQLTWALHENKGLRSSDWHLRELLGSEREDWVASQNSLSAVPVRGRQIAEYMAPSVGTVLETHPRACLYLWRPDLECEIDRYKGPDSDPSAIGCLWKEWVDSFGIIPPCTEHETDGAVDALVCATIAALFHRCPNTLCMLPHEGEELRGFGPFVVLSERRDQVSFV